MNYKQRYEDILAMAKELREANQSDEGINRWIDKIFPELAESEDERIRKGLINYFNDFTLPTFGGLDPKKILAWLEKQGKQEQDPCEHCKDKCLNCHNFPCIDKRAFEQGKSALEAIKEKKVDNANKIEPKFKVGDWIVRGKTIAQILDIQEQYYVGLDVDGNDFTSSRFLSDDKIHFWTIQDAKDGDVLACGDKVTDCPFIFHNLTKELNPRSYCGVNTLCHFQDNDENDGFWCKSDEVRPATKEQRDLLFQKMKEEGYEWDAEKKELRKIEQNPAWSEEDENRINRLIAYFEDKESFTAEDDIAYANWLISLKGKVRPQTNQEWSEEDERIYKVVLELIDSYSKGTIGGCIIPPNVERYAKWLKSLKDRVLPKSTWNEEDITKLKSAITLLQNPLIACDEVNDGVRIKTIEWLKSLRPQSHWKPSDEQIEEFRYYLDDINWEGEILVSLYNDLKKLREELL